ncbi:unnamed protein product [Ilex paraguariensis]|uniref:Glutaredoxin domain-containing protein n=1 Tax=Ilex paraguariensis TaxID=185542 RepID=A0ABC8RKM8_9AQUA
MGYGIPHNKSKHPNSPRASSHFSTTPTSIYLFPNYFHSIPLQFFRGEILEKITFLGKMERVSRMVSERPVVIFSKSSCCMCHTIKSLFSDFGVNPTVHELDEVRGSRDIEQALVRFGCNPTVPAVFIGGKLVGGANEVMSLHLKRSLKPMLKQAGALWV